MCIFRMLTLLEVWRCSASSELSERRFSRSLWADDVVLEAVKRWSDQSATQHDLKTPAGCNPIIAATDSDRRAPCNAPPQHKNKAIKVGGRKIPLRQVRSSHVLLLSSWPPPKPCPHTDLLSHLISGKHCSSHLLNCLILIYGVAGLMESIRIIIYWYTTNSSYVSGTVWSQSLQVGEKHLYMKKKNSQ